jgi:hypothetical protein
MKAFEKHMDTRVKPAYGTIIQTLTTASAAFSDTGKAGQ